MEKIKKILFIYLLISGPGVFAGNFDSIYESASVVYSPSDALWYRYEVHKDDIIFKKYTSEGSGSYSHYISGCSDVGLNSNYEFIFEGRLIGVDNENLKYYEILYKDKELVQELLTYEQVQEIFSDIDVIKISDFSRGTYTIINPGENTEILLFNDTEENFHKYFITPKESISDSKIKGLVKLPRRGKVVFSHIGDKKLNQYTIKVR